MKIKKMSSQVDVALSQSVVLQVGGWMYFIHLISAMNLSSDPHRYPDQQGWHRDARYKKRFLLETTTLSTDEDCIRLINNMFSPMRAMPTGAPTRVPSCHSSFFFLDQGFFPQKVHPEQNSMFLHISFGFKPEGER